MPEGAGRGNCGRRQGPGTPRSGRETAPGAGTAAETAPPSGGGAGREADRAYERHGKAGGRELPDVEEDWGRESGPGAGGAGAARWEEKDGRPAENGSRRPSLGGGGTETSEPHRLHEAAGGADEDGGGAGNAQRGAYRPYPRPGGDRPTGGGRAERMPERAGRLGDQKTGAGKTASRRQGGTAV